MYPKHAEKRDVASKKCARRRVQSVFWSIALTRRQIADEVEEEIVVARI
jgi:hypothetical protein